MLKPVLRALSLCSSLFTLALASISTASASASAAGGPVLIDTRQGVIIGQESALGDSFLGIPYAEPPVGARRLQPSIPHFPWTQPWDARHLSPVCPQPADPLAVVGPVQDIPVIGAEDCLYLNIHRPREAADSVTTRKTFPVMVWLHGGGYLTGSGGENDGSVLATREGVLVVTVNYRLGALGFLSSPQLSHESFSKTSGNYGLQDQLLALRWIKENIAAFSGDPERITLFGQSAGGISICDLMTAPDAIGLFQRAIVQSGSCMGRLMMTPRLEAEAIGQRITEHLGCSDPAQATTCLRSLPAADIVRRSSSVAGETIGPLYGDYVLPQRPDAAFRSGQFHHVPVIDGTTHDEARAFVLLYALAKIPFTMELYQHWAVLGYGAKQGAQILEQYPAASYGSPMLAYATASTNSTFACRAKRWNDVLAKQVPVYAYEFNDQKAATFLPQSPAVPHLGAFHSADLVYVFQTKGLVAEPSLLSPDQLKLSDQMMDYWGRFAHTGNPNGPGAQPWSIYSGQEHDILQLAPGVFKSADAFSKEHDCDFWEGLDR